MRRFGCSPISLATCTYIHTYRVLCTYIRIHTEYCMYHTTTLHPYIRVCNEVISYRLLRTSVFLSIQSTCTYVLLSLACQVGLPRHLVNYSNLPCKLSVDCRKYSVHTYRLVRNIFKKKENTHSKNVDWLTQCRGSKAQVSQTQF